MNKNVKNRQKPEEEMPHFKQSGYIWIFKLNSLPPQTLVSKRGGGTWSWPR